MTNDNCFVHYHANSEQYFVYWLGARLKQTFRTQRGAEACLDALRLGVIVPVYADSAA